MGAGGVCTDGHGRLERLEGRGQGGAEQPFNASGAKDARGSQEKGGLLFG